MRIVTRFKIFRRTKSPNLSFKKFLRLTMAATQSNTKEVISKSLMKIQSTNFQVDPNVSSYPEELKMLIVALKKSALSTAMFSSFPVPMTWLSMAASTASFNYNICDNLQPGE